MQAKNRITCTLLIVMVLGLMNSVASAQTEVFGTGVIRTAQGASDGMNLFTQVSVDAWIDEDGVAHGRIVYIGDWEQTLPAQGNTGHAGGPSNPWIGEVTAIYFAADNTVEVDAELIHAPNMEDIGFLFSIVVTDNSGTDVPDLLNFAPIEVGNFTIR
jgi:hypothetical protein